MTLSYTSAHAELHYVDRAGWLRAAVLGANDGIVSVSSLIVGVAAADPSPTAVLVAGAAGLAAGAFPLASSSADSALLINLAPGAYTAQVSAASGGAGVALIEVYDLSAAAAGQKLLNISTRATAGATLWITWFSGWLNGVMPVITPASGSRSV